MPKVELIPAKVLPDHMRPLKVAAYCRVSTTQEIQYHSLEAQRQYYERFIKQHIDWRFAGIYADQASGRYNRKMKDFQRMLADCRAGLIDKILVKSISRLGRNTVEFLQAIGTFNALGVDVYFEEENLHGTDPVAVKMLTIFASLYQQESETKSFITGWGHHVRFADSSSKLYNRPCYGYRQGDDGTLEIVPEQAVVVRCIFAERLAGRSLREITRALEADGIPAPRGGKCWGVETIRTILGNEKYFGAVMLGKTYVKDYFKGRQAVNHGEAERYVVEGHHEGFFGLYALFSRGMVI